MALTTLPAFRLWGAAGTQYIPLKNMKSATGFFRIVIFYFHFVSFIFFSGTPWQFIFFFVTCCVPAVNLGLRGGKLVVAHIKSVCYMPCFFGQRQYPYYTDYIRKLQLNLALISILIITLVIMTVTVHT
jgi:hypothetical protein